MVTLAKIARPSLAGIFPRKRLFRLLDRFRLSPVVFISGPPGSGKTSLVTSYLQDRKLPCLGSETTSSNQGQTRQVGKGGGKTPLEK